MSPPSSIIWKPWRCASHARRGPVDVAQSCNNLAELYRTLGRYAEAERLHQRARAIRERSRARSSRGGADAQPGRAVRHQGRYDEAEPLYRRALEIRVASYGDDHLTAAETRNNLATLYYAQRRLKEARPLYERALAVEQKQLGPTHPSL